MLLVVVLASFVRAMLLMQELGEKSDNEDNPRDSLGASSTGPMRIPMMGVALA